MHHGMHGGHSGGHHRHHGHGHGGLHYGLFALAMRFPWVMIGIILWVIH